MKRKICLIIIILLCIPTMIYGQEINVTENNSISETINIDELAIDFLNNAFIDWDKLENTTQKIAKEIYVPPENAFLNKKGNVIPEKFGMKLNRDLFKKLLIDSFYAPNISTIKIPKSRVYLKVDSELLSEIKINELGSYKTNYQESNKKRTINLKLATKAIDNYVVFPNQTFSFNDVVGERTKEKGYQIAPVIINGELSEDVGGGICQVSSTLFNAVNLQGIDIVERYSHSRRVPYVPSGRDATVSWMGPDFVFKNKLSHPILIRASSNKGIIIIKLYSSDHVKAT